GLVLDFAAGVYGVGGVLGSLASSVSLMRASAATRIDTAGALQTLGPDLARIDHDPQTLAPRGLLLETGRSNLFVQSATPADQTISLNAVPHVLSFYGTGSIVLSGGYSGTLVGTGSFPQRVSLLFTPTVGNLTLTLSGDVTAPQLEEGGVGSSYIPSGAASTARAEDVASVGLSNWFDASQGTLVFNGALDSAAANDRIIEIDDGTTATRLSILWNTVLGKPQFQVWDAGVLQAAIAPAGNAIALGSYFRVAITYAANDFAVSLNGGALATDTTGILPAGLGTLRLGRSVWGAQGLMVAEGVTYYPAPLSDAEVIALSA
ncbi:MAG: hypothetical protein ACC619_09375, partial [Paracoccaceae bacterium]